MGEALQVVFTVRRRLWFAEQNNSGILNWCFEDGLPLSEGTCSRSKLVWESRLLRVSWHIAASIHMVSDCSLWKATLSPPVSLCHCHSSGLRTKYFLWTCWSVYNGKWWTLCDHSILKCRYNIYTNKKTQTYIASTSTYHLDPFGLVRTPSALTDGTHSPEWI